MRRRTFALGAPDPANARVLDHLKDQLIAVLLHRLGGSLAISTHELDTARGTQVYFQIDQSHVFHFSLKESQS